MMRAVLLAAAAALVAMIPAAPALAQSSEGGVRVHRNSDGGDHDRWRDRDGEWDRDGFGRFDRRRNRRFQETVVLLGPSDDWDNNRSWDADKWNDWWHERTWRSYPRWVADNRNCDRRWWSGGVWRC